MGTALAGGGGKVPIKYVDGTLMMSAKVGTAVQLADQFTYYSNLAMTLIPFDMRVYTSSVDVTDAGGAAIFGFDVSSCGEAAAMTLMGYGADAFAAAGTEIFWTGGSVWSCPLNGCTQPKAIWMAPGTNYAAGLATDGSDLYWSTLGGDIMSCPVSGCTGAPKVLLSTVATFAPYLVLDSANVYASSDHGILRCSKSGCASPTVVGTGSGPLATDGQEVYWTNGDVFGCPVSGCASGTEIAASGAAAGIAVDDQNVYWADTKLGMILRVSK